MCFSLEVSLLGYIFAFPQYWGLTSSLDPNTKWIGFFMSYIIQMQLLEAAMWYDVDCKSGLNNFASLMAFYFTLLQPMANYLASRQAIGPNQQLTMAMIPYFAAVCYFIVYKHPKEEELCTKPYEEGNHWLSWSWLQFKRYDFWSYVWLISFFLPFFWLPDWNSNGGKAAIFLFITLMISFNFLGLDYTSEPSVWCLFQAIMPLFLK